MQALFALGEPGCAARCLVGYGDKLGELGSESGSRMALPAPHQCGIELRRGCLSPPLGDLAQHGARRGMGRQLGEDGCCQLTGTLPVAFPPKGRHLGLVRLEELAAERGEPGRKFIAAVDKV